MTMPNQPRTPQRTVRIPDAVWESAQVRASQRDETVSDVVRRALERYATATDDHLDAQSEADLLVDRAIALRDVDRSSAVDSPNLPGHRERRAIRGTYRLTQAQLGHLLGVHALTISRWEKGQSEPVGEKRRLYAEFLTNGLTSEQQKRLADAT